MQAEQRRHREFISRIERERQLQLENYSIKLQAVELESASLRDEVSRLREQLEKVRVEKSLLENSLDEARREAESAHELERQALSRSNEANHMLEAAREELASRVEDQQKMEELIQEISHLRARNKSMCSILIALILRGSFWPFSMLRKLKVSFEIFNVFNLKCIHF